MKRTIKKNKHHASPFTVGIWFGKKEIRRDITFFPSCKYNINDEDQEDTNKLFGIGYLPHHHIDSARFGWRYDVLQNKFIISAYCYVDEQRIIKELCTVDVMQTCTFIIKKEVDGYTFKVQPKHLLYQVKSVFIPLYHTKYISYPLGFYFGGDKTAPHDMMIEIKKV